MKYTLPDKPLQSPQRSHSFRHVHLKDKNKHKTDFTNQSDAGGLCIKNFTQETPRILLPQFWLFFKRNGFLQSGHLAKGMAFHHLDIFQKEGLSTIRTSFKRKGFPPSGHLSKGRAFHHPDIFQKEGPSTIWSSFKRKGLPQSSHLSNLVIFQKGFSQSGHLSKWLFTIWSSFKREGETWV